MAALCSVAYLEPLLGAAAGAPATPAVCVRLSTYPVRPVAGQPVRLELRTLTPVTKSQGSLRLEPRAVPSSYPFHVSASRARQLVLIHVDRSSDPEVWTGEFVLGETGLWHLLVQDTQAGSRPDPRCLPEFPLVVSAATAQRHPAESGRSGLRLTLILAIAILAIIVGSTLFVVIRGRASVGQRPGGPG